MEKKWTYCAVYSIIQMHFVRVAWEETLNAEANIYAFPGSDVNLTCQTQKKGFLVQTQWSKINYKEELVGLYHPLHGFHCYSENPCQSLVSYKEIPGNISEWTLHLRNMSSALSGKYECTFTLYPEGIRTKIYNVLLQTTVTYDEQRSNHTIETEINRTLEIPCFQNMSSEISSEFTFAWLLEDNGIQETLLTRDHPISNSTLFKDRVKLGADYALDLSPVQIHDDHRTFSCQIIVKPGKILRSSTMVKVFAKPEIPVIVENNSTDVLGKRVFTCLLKKVFPAAKLTWLIDGNSPQGEKEINITNEVRKDQDGFWEQKSVLTRLSGTMPAQSNNMTVWCVALSPVPGNKMWNMSSEKITVSLGSVNPPTVPPVTVTESSPGTQPSPTKSTSHIRFPDASSTAFVTVNTPSPTTMPQTSNFNVTSQGFNDSWISRGEEAENSVSWMPSEIYSSSSSDEASTHHGDVFASTTDAFSEISTTANISTKNNHVQITGIVKKPRDGMSWPVIVAALLFFCMLIFGLGVRKWCQYQKEILERPPPFKPPPPPIKYTCIQESIGGDLPCHEMEPL
ncbi:T-cell surface protein tactile isoform X1 [Sorex araneus]|uniref:T-cell surface protein tactile isoform X1 n=1 Tax=Sorex araneus TaxID=42254 RepID=UPI0024338E56|nr:T-cell surface protein tactile isoform X1 [Sorex araneus]